MRGRAYRLPNALLDRIETVPVVFAVGADVRRIALMDGSLERPPITGASDYPFCWSVLLAAAGCGLGAVMTTFLSPAESVAVPALGLREHHAIAAAIFVGVAQRLITRLRRAPVASSARIDWFDSSPLTA